MTRDRKKPGVAFWASVVLIAAVLYAASFGPACWISSRFGHGAGILPTMYGPLLAGMRIGEEEKERQHCAAYSWMAGQPERVPNAPGGWLARFASFGAVAASCSMMRTLSIPRCASGTSIRSPPGAASSRCPFQ